MSVCPILKHLCPHPVKRDWCSCMHTLVCLQIHAYIGSSLKNASGWGNFDLGKTSSQSSGTSWRQNRKWTKFALCWSWIFMSQGALLPHKLVWEFIAKQRSRSLSPSNFCRICVCGLAFVERPAMFLNVQANRGWVTQWPKAEFLSIHIESFCSIPQKTSYHLL